MQFARSSLKKKSEKYHVWWLGSNDFTNTQPKTTQTISVALSYCGYVCDCLLISNTFHLYCCKFKYPSLKLTFFIPFSEFWICLFWISFCYLHSSFLSINITCNAVLSCNELIMVASFVSSEISFHLSIKYRGVKRWSSNFLDFIMGDSTNNPLPNEIK